MTEWWVYLIQCKDGSLYCGIARDVQRRFSAHQRGAGARYTRGRGPLLLVYQEPAKSHAAALVRERQIKGMPRAQKQALVAVGDSR